MSDHDQPVLRRAQEHFQGELARRESEGDRTVLVHRFEMPWSITELGPARETAADLKRFGAAAVSNGVRQAFTADGQELHWIDSAEELVAQFFDTVSATLVGADGRSSWTGSMPSGRR